MGNGAIPVAIVEASQAQVAAITYKLNSGSSDLYLGREKVVVHLVDLSTGSLSGEWQANHPPLSISPDGSLVAISSSDAERDGCFGIDLVDASTGSLKLHISADSLFPPGKQPRRPFGRLVAKFIGNRKLIVTPDSGIDQSGEPVGRSLKLISAVDGGILNVLKPEEFGPTGELQVSRDQRTFATVSRYVPARYLTGHRRIPTRSGPELIVYSEDKLTMRIKLPNLLGSRSYHLLDTAGVRLSDDSSTISVVENYAIAILSRCP